MATDNNSTPVVHPSKPTRLLEDFRCLKCNNLYLKNQTFEAIQEDIGGESCKFRIAVHRWYMPCEICAAQIIFRTNLITHAFTLEYGAMPVDSYAVNPRQRKKVGPVPEGAVDPEKFLKNYADSVPSMMIVRAIECTLDFVKRSESVGNVSDYEIYHQGAANIQSGMFPNKCPHFVIRNDDHIFMSPFVKLLTKVTWSHLPNFLKELRDFLTTDKYSGVVFVSGEPSKRGKDKVQIPPALRAPETNKPFLEALDKFSIRNMKAPLSTALEHHPAVLVPFSMQCTKCSHIIRKGERFPMLEEFFGEDSPVIRMRLIRYYMECPKCAASLVFRSDFQHNKYIKEYGVVPIVPPKLDVKEEAPGSSEPPREPVDPMYLLTQFPKIPESRKKVIDDLETALYEFRSEMENSIVDVWAPKVQKEKEDEKKANFIVPQIISEKKLIRPFAETMGMVTEYHCKRFYVSLLHQLATEQFLAKTTNYFEPFLKIATSEAFLNDLKQWWRKIHFSNLLAPKLTMVPFGMRCLKCSNCIYKGKKLEMTQEILGDGSSLLRMTLHRFYMNCPHCSSAMIFRSNLQQSRYIKEYGIELLPEDSKKVENEKAKEKYCNPMRLLKKQRPLTDSEKKLVDDIEENIDQINRSEGTAQIKMTRMIREEIEKQIQGNSVPQPLRIRDWPTNPFSDTVQLVPDFHTSRFIHAIINQLTTPEYLRVAKKRSRHFVRDNFMRQIDDFDFLNSTITPASPAILPIHLKCKKCSKMIYLGHTLDMKCETIQGVLGIPVKLFRYYFGCPHCSSQIIIRSDFADQDFRVEFGAEKVLKPKGKWNQGIPNGIMDPRNDIKRFVRDEKRFLDILDQFEFKVTKLMFEEENSPEMQMMMARTEAEAIPGYIGTKHKAVSNKGMEQLLEKHCPYGLSVTFIPDNGIYHAMMAVRKQLMTEEFRSVVFNK